MRPLRTLASVAMAVVLVAGTAAAQARERPAGASTAGSGTLRTDGGPASGGGGSVGSSSGSGTYVGGSSSSGAGSGSTYTPPSSSSSGSSSGGSAVFRPGGHNGSPGAANPNRPRYGSADDTAVPRGARPNPGVPSRGDATLRPGSPGTRPQEPRHRPGDGVYYGDSPWYLYGAYGLGYMYYDPLWWGYYWPTDGYYGDYGWGGSGAPTEEAPTGSLKLKIEPRDAEVYVDGDYMGVVDDFDGIFQHMELQAGPHHVEVRANGYRTITFDVRIEPSDTVTYRGELQSLSKK